MAKTRRMQRRSSTGGRSARLARPWLAELLGHPHQSWWRQLMGWVIRARAELSLLTAVITGQVVLIEHYDLSHPQAVMVEGGIVVVALAIPGTRRTLISRMWSVLDRHRIRACFIQTRTMTPAGSLPYLLWSSPTPVGERVRVWLRAGLSVNDIIQITDELASACYAAETRVGISPKVATYVVIDVIRRDPLTGKRLIKAGVTKSLPTNRTTFPGQVTAEELDAEHTNGEVRPLPDRATLPTTTAPADHPTMRAAKTRANGTSGAAGRTTHPTHTNESTGPGVLGVDGTDVSDYV